MRNIAAIIPVFASRDFIYGFLKQTVHFDQVVFLTHDNVWADYVYEHGCSTKPDDTADIIREFMKNNHNVEIHHVVVDNDKWKRGINHWNAGLPFVQGCDIVFRLDIDYFFTPEDWGRIMKFVRETDYDAYQIDASPRTTTNYYVTGSLDYGLDDSDGQFVLAFNTKYPLEHEQNTTGKTCRLEEQLPGIKLHHLRGWKPKYTKEWADKLNKKWTVAPQEIKNYFI